MIKFISVIMAASLAVYIGICDDVDPPGHMQPLGSHKSPIKVEERESVPDPIELFEKYIKTGTPTIMRGAAGKFKYFKKWGSDLYLKTLYGNWYVTVEVGKYEGSVFGKDIYMTFGEFLESYKKENYYLIQNIAPKNPLRRDIFLLKSMACGGYANLINQILLLFSSGKTQSALHWDDVENMHCVFDGTKEWILFDRKDRHRIPKMEKYGAYGAMDCRSVDMYKYPEIQELDWYHAFLNAGDCLFLPKGWPHHVRSEGNERNMALAVWFGPVHHPNLTDCPDDLSELPEVIPVGERTVSWKDGAKSMVYELFEYSDEISVEKCLQKAKKHNLTKSDVEKMADSLDVNNDGMLSVGEVENMSDNILDKLPRLKLKTSPYFEVQPDGTVKDEL